MTRKIIIAALAAAMALLLSAEAAPELALRWFGQSCFLITSPEGGKLLIDPFEQSANLLYSLPDAEADVVLTTHNHFDHNNVGIVKGKPEIIKGLKIDGAWNDIEKSAAGFQIKSTRSFHDDQGGTARGNNAIFTITAGNVRFVHLGDLGGALDDNQIKNIGAVDVLFVPVGGKYTIEPNVAWKVVGQLKPKVIVPMHYKTANINIPLKPVENFLKGHESSVKKLTANTVPVILPSKQEIWVFPAP